jgi:hypothetical protein
VTIAPDWVGARPLYMTARTPSRPTLGPRVAEVATLLGKPLLPWQRAALDVALELDETTGYLAYREADVVVMRQNGKSELLLPTMTHRCNGFDRALTDWIYGEYGFRLPAPGPQRVLYLAQNADEARKKWRDVHLQRLQDSPFMSAMADVRLRLASEAIFWRNGSVWSPGSATGKTAGTGDTLDLGVIDEGWSRKDNRTELGLRPTMLTRPWAQLWVASMVPGPSRVAPHEWPWLLTKMKAGRARVEAGINRGVFYIEFGAPPGSDPRDPATWWSSMPALGRTIRQEAVQADFDDPTTTLADFCAEYLSWIPVSETPRWSVISEGTWQGRYDPHSLPQDPIALAASAGEGRDVCSIGLAAMRADGNLHVELVDHRPGVEWAAERLLGLVDQWGACAIAIAPTDPVASILPALEVGLAMAGHDVKLLRPNTRQEAQACGRFFDWTGQVDEVAVEPDDDEQWQAGTRRLFHLNQRELDLALASATRKFTGQLWRWVPASPRGDVTPIRAVTLAAWAGMAIDWAGGSYDIGSSLG